MIYRITPPEHLRSSVTLPASKSISNRVLVMQALTAATGTELHNLADCDDTRVMRQWLATRPACVDIGAAGTAMRFSTALLSVSAGTHLITGTERMRHRPIGILVDALRSLGARIAYEAQDGYPPLLIEGNPQLQGGQLSLRGDVSSQFISALLMIGPVLRQGLTLHLQGDVVSRPYIDLTLALMRQFGAKAEWQDERTIAVAPQPYEPRTFVVENDWSAASYWYQIMALGTAARESDFPDEIVLEGLFPDSLQGDSAVARMFEPLGVRSEFIEGNRVRLTRDGQPAERLDLDFVRTPDLAQTLVVTCCMMGVPFRFSGLQSLRIKETDRLAALQTELAKLGYAVHVEGDSVMEWNADDRTSHAPAAPVIDTYDDHRMAMAFAPCALRRGDIQVRHPEVVSKSYPTYWDTLRQAGFTIAEQDAD